LECPERAGSSPRKTGRSVLTRSTKLLPLFRDKIENAASRSTTWLWPAGCGTLASGDCRTKNDNMRGAEVWRVLKPTYTRMRREPFLWFSGSTVAKQSAAKVQRPHPSTCGIRERTPKKRTSFGTESMNVAPVSREFTTASCISSPDRSSEKGDRPGHQTQRRGSRRFQTLHLQAGKAPVATVEGRSPLLCSFSMIVMSATILGKSKRLKRNSSTPRLHGRFSNSVRRPGCPSASLLRASGLRLPLFAG
jgi:hypothetical protein